MSAPPELVAPDVVERVGVADDVELAVRRWHGSGGTPIVLVHGLASNARLWDGVAGRLVVAGHPVVAVDQRGHGRSSKPVPDRSGPGGTTYSMSTVTDDLAVVVDRVAGSSGTRPVLAGQSWGGNVVLEFAARFPGRATAVAAVDGGTIDLRSQFDDWDTCAAQLAPPPLAGTPVDELEAMLRRMHPDWPETGIQGTLACFEIRADATVAPWLDLDRHLAVLAGLWDHRPAERYPHIVDPVLLLAAETPGADDGWMASKRIGVAAAHDAMNRATTRWMPGDHDLHAQFPGEVADLVAALTRDADPRTKPR